MSRLARLWCRVAHRKAARIKVIDKAVIDRMGIDDIGLYVHAHVESMHVECGTCGRRL